MKTYLTVWQYYKNGDIQCKKTAKGRIIVLKELRKIKRGKPPQYTREEIIKQVHRLCKDRYVKASEFPSHLYKLCKSKVYGIGSVRAAKWEAKILHSKRWIYSDFIQCVIDYCSKQYREDKDWPDQLRGLAEHFSGSIRRAKWEAGIIKDIRRKNRKNSLVDLWPKKKFLKWVHEFCNDGYKKADQWPGYMRHLAVLHCKTIRGAKWEAKILHDQRKNKRADLKIVKNTKN